MTCFAERSLQAGVHDRGVLRAPAARPRPMSLEQGEPWTPGKRLPQNERGGARLAFASLTGLNTAVKWQPSECSLLANIGRDAAQARPRRAARGSRDRRTHGRHARDRRGCRSSLAQVLGASPPWAAARRSPGGPACTAAVGARSRRCTTALVKWVVPIITTSMAAGSQRGRFRQHGACSAATTPDMTSAGGGGFHAGQHDIVAHP